MKVLIAIDPGADGAIACRDGEGGFFTIEFKNTTDKDISESLWEMEDFRESKCWGEVFAFLENVGGYRPGNSGPASVKFARSVGKLEGMLLAMGIPFERVAPVSWMKALGAMPKEKKDRKNRIKSLMQERYPHIKVTLSNADALGILTWAIKNTA